eukprot:gene10127-11162_t
MKLEEAQVDDIKNATENDAEFNGINKENIRQHCPNCATPMVSMKENSVQCELWTDENRPSGGKLQPAVPDGRRGSTHSVTETQEHVTYDESVSTEIDEAATAPDEIVLVTRSFENEAQPTAPPRRSSISQFFNNIKSLGTRSQSPESEPGPKKRFLDESDAELPQTLRSGVRRNSSGPTYGLGIVHEVDSDDSSSQTGPNQPQLKRHSVQLSNGQVVQEDIEEYSVGSAVTMDDDVMPGEINIVTRCFEMPENYAPRRESIIDKLNFVKMIGKNRKRKDQSDRSFEEVDEPVRRQAASGVRRKSITPAALAGLGENKNLREEAMAVDVSRSALAAPGQESDVRYVTSGIRRGSIAAVSAAPPCRGGEEESNKDTQRNGPLLQPDDDTEMRYITTGIRRGSVAAVSAAPPCHVSDEEDAGNSELLGIQVPSDSAEHTGEQSPDNLRSGVRRRSLIPAGDGKLIASSSPIMARPDYDIPCNPLANETIYTSGESDAENNEDDCCEDESEANVNSSGRIAGNIDKKINNNKKKTKKKEKGVVNLFEALTGREAGVDYEDADAKKVVKKQEEVVEEDNWKKTSFNSSNIPQIMLSFDNEEGHEGDEGGHTKEETFL